MEGMEGKNFFHAIWREELEDEKISQLERFLEAMFENFKTSYKDDIFSVLHDEGIPLIEVGIACDNVIGVKVSGHDDIGVKHVEDVGEEFMSVRNYVSAMLPDVLVEGYHSCMLNCGECCNRAPVETIVTRRYCEYWSEVGGYCLALFSKEEARDEACDAFWCPPLREPYSVRTDEGPFGLRPTIREMKSYTREEREAFIEVYKRLGSGEPLSKVIELLPRTREVMLYKRSLKGLNSVLKKHGMDEIYNIGSRKELKNVEEILKTEGIYHEAEEYVKNLYLWMEIATSSKHRNDFR